MNESKPWYQSLTIISAVVTALISLLGLFHVNINDLSTDLTNGLLGLGLLIGTIFTIVGRVRASKNIGGGNSTTSALIAAFLLASAALGFVGCSSTTETASTSTDGAAVTTTASGWTKFLAALRSAVHTGLTDLQTAANALYTITSNLPADQLAVYLADFGVGQSTITDVVAAYKQAGASAAAASKIASTIDGATVASQSTK